jgi:hypothetical protein
MPALDQVNTNDCVIKYTSKGEPYYVFTNPALNTHDEYKIIEEAKKEFVRERLSFFTLPSELGKK